MNGFWCGVADMTERGLSCRTLLNRERRLCSAAAGFAASCGEAVRDAAAPRTQARGAGTAAAESNNDLRLSQNKINRSAALQRTIVWC